MDRIYVENEPNMFFLWIKFVLQVVHICIAGWPHICVLGGPHICCILSAVGHSCMSLVSPVTFCADLCSEYSYLLCIEPQCMCLCSRSDDTTSGAGACWKFGRFLFTIHIVDG